MIPWPGIVLAVHDLGLVGMQPQPYLDHPVFDGRQHFPCLPFGHAVHYRVIGVTFEPDVRVFPIYPPVERIVHEQVGQYRRDRGPL
jgi:hypothetical protein